MSFTCPDCLRTSNNPHDEIHSYCGNCHSYKPRNLVLTPFQAVIARTIHGEFPAVRAVQAAVAFQMETGAAWQVMMLEAIALFHATSLTADQWSALDQVCGLAAGKARNRRHSSG